MTTPTISAALDTFQQAANRGTAVYLSLELVQELRDALKAEPDADALAARPLLEQVAAMADCIGANSVGQITAISNRAAAWLRENPPGRPVAIEPRGCPTPGACSCVEPTPPAPVPLNGYLQGYDAGRRDAAADAQQAADAAQNPPALEPGELAAWLKEEAEAYRNTCGTNLASQNLDNAATLLLEQGAELTALRGVPVAGISDEHRDAVREAVAEALGDAYDCQRVWSAWSCGTMGPDDFTLTAEDDDRVAEIADAAIEAFRSFQVPAPPAGEVQPPHPTFLDAIRLAQGCHDYSGGHSGQQGEAFQDGVGTVVAVLKKAAVGPWDSQTMAVFGIGSAPQAGEGEA